VPVFAQRINFVGEPGWELYAPTEYILTLWDTLIDAGTPLGLRPGGQRAIQALQMEKGQRVWGVDIGPETTPDEAGLGFAVHLDKQFRGRAALLALRASGGPSRRLRCLVLDDSRTVCLGTEPVRVDGRACGRVTSGGYGYRVGASIAYAYLPSTVPVGTPVEVGVFGTWVRATVRAEPLYDSRNLNRRA
jgi:4-methylaminobutanoate oxidase (formaldehyde-forming)